jgi:hypothetical protein
MLATLVGLSMLLALVGDTVTLASCLLGRRLRARQAHRHPQQAAVRERTRQARRLAAEWPLLAQTLGLGYRDQFPRQHRFPAAEVVVDDQGVTATVAAMAGAGLADYQHTSGYLADTWGCVTVRAEQQGPGLIRLLGVAVTSLPGRPGFHRVRTPQVDHHQVAAIIRATAGLRRDPGDLLAPGPGVARLRRADHSGDAA